MELREPLLAERTLAAEVRRRRGGVHARSGDGGVGDDERLADEELIGIGNRVRRDDERVLGRVAVEALRDLAEVSPGWTV